MKFKNGAELFGLVINNTAVGKHYYRRSLIDGRIEAVSVRYYDGKGGLAIQSYDADGSYLICVRNTGGPNVWTGRMVKADGTVVAGRFLGMELTSGYNGSAKVGKGETFNVDDAFAAIKAMAEAFDTSSIDLVATAFP